MSDATSGELAVLDEGFDYSLIAVEETAAEVRAAADKIRQMVRRTLAELIEIGRTLWAVKDALPHGQFRNWLAAEFGWRERSVRNFMAVADQFGKSANFADLPIQPSAAYVLAAPSVPDAARQDAVGRAEAGERITMRVAREIVARAKGRKGTAKRFAAGKLAPRLGKVLERYRERCSPTDLGELARQLREFADAVDRPQETARRGRRRAGSGRE